MKFQKIVTGMMLNIVPMPVVNGLIGSVYLAMLHVARLNVTGDLNMSSLPITQELVGKVLKVDHKRKGKFKIKVIFVDGVLVIGYIIEGVSVFPNHEYLEVGDTIELNCSRPFIEVTE